MNLAKRSLDVIGAFVGLILLSPTFLFVGIIVKMTSPGPVFFGQSRVGLGGRLFRCWKFRSMRKDAEVVLKSDPILYQRYLANDFKLPEGEDPRITPIGRILRKTSLDEIPQLWNVLLGEMSLVGPRPLVQQEVDLWYGERRAQLLSVRPGVTGLWQVSGRSDIDYPERAELELRYISERSLWYDICILVRTVTAVISRKGAH